MNYDFSDCTLCPRTCHADRTDYSFCRIKKTDASCASSEFETLNKPTGFCGAGTRPILARAALHMWEEPCISGKEGSGTVFFSGCNLGCVFCQNYDIAHAQKGTEISVQRLSEIFLELQAKKANNINLVTPTHFVPQIAEALMLAKNHGLILPIVYNTSGYELTDTLHMLDGLIDIYLPDLKYYSSDLSRKYSHAADYFEKASLAIEEMVRQTGEPLFRSQQGKFLSAEEYDDEALLCKGTIVRHLLLPGCLEDSKDVLKYLHDTFGNRIFISIMNQYTPLKYVADIPELNRRVTEKEYDALVDYAISIGIENGFIQEGDVAVESFIPDFNGEGV